MKNTNTLLEKYISAAVTHGEATLEGDGKTANKQYATLTKFYRKLEKDQSFAEVFLEELFHHTNASVRTWAAAHALGLNLRTDKALEILQAVSEDRNIGVVRLDAEMILREWMKKGRLKF
jgi:uncharacterized protein YaaN involved in tellurite resistance